MCVRLYVRTKWPLTQIFGILISFIDRGSRSRRSQEKNVIGYACALSGETGAWSAEK